MASYDLFLESGPKKRKTMVHVLELLGCVATGRTTDEAIAATPEAIRAYRRFLRRHGEAIAEPEPFEVRVAEHVTEGEWLGDGSPYLTFDADLEPVSEADIERFLRRADAILGELAAWAERQPDDALDAAPAAGGRAARPMIVHIIGAQGAFLAYPLASAPGFGKIRNAAERGELPLPEALLRAAELTRARVGQVPESEWNRVRLLPSGSYTLRKAFRRILEHGWEHLSELSRRPGGPAH